MKKIIIGSDHAGFRLKEALKKHLVARGFKVADAGTYSEESCDYPDFAFAVSSKVSAGRFRRGILICKSGIGNSIVANKLPGVRAALCRDIICARLSRQHNDSNILVLAAAFTAAGPAKRIVGAWLNARFAGGRHGRRVEKISKIERCIAHMNAKRRGSR